MQCRYSGQDHWICGLDGSKLYLYNLPDVLSAKTVWFVEGEKDCESLVKLGLVATCNPMGAGKWPGQVKKHGLHQPLKDKHVIILPDNDKPGSKHAAAVANSLLRFAESVKVLQLHTIWPEIFEKGDVSDLIEHLGPEQAKAKLAHLAEGTPELTSPVLCPNVEPTDTEGGPEQGKSRFHSLLDAVKQSDGPSFLDQYGDAWITVKVEGRMGNLRIRSRAFQRHAVRLSVDTCGEPATEDLVKKLANYLEACAEERRVLWNRFAASYDEVWIDVGNVAGDAFHVTTDGWTVRKDPQGRFLRHPHQQELPFPASAGSLAEILDFCPLTNENDRILFLVWLVTAPLGHIPRPLIIWTGPPGSGKSLFCELVRSMLDPSAVPTVSLPRDSSELVQMMNNHSLVMLDNVRNLPGWASEALCRAVTGGGFSKRQLFTDGDDVICHLRRTGIINAVFAPTNAPDLVDRAILLESERIAEASRRDCQTLIGRFEIAKPRLLAGLLQALSRTLALRPQVRLERLPRMADWCLFAYAAAEALDIGGDRFISAYRQNITGQHEELLSTDPVASAIREFMADKSCWSGTSTTLYKPLCLVAHELGLSASWPRAPHALSRRLRELAHNLEQTGISIQWSRTDVTRTIVLKKNAPMTREKASSSSYRQTDPDISTLRMTPCRALSKRVMQSVIANTGESCSNDTHDAYDGSCGISGDNQCCDLSGRSPNLGSDQESGSEPAKRPVENTMPHVEPSLPGNRL